jgi:two-component system, NtrC family, sensor kinase
MKKGRWQIGDLMSMLKVNLDKMAQHGIRADSIIKNMLLHSRQGSGERRPADINAILEESLNLAYHGTRAEKQGFNITLEKPLDPAAGEVELFPQEIARVLSAKTRNLGDQVKIRIRDNGIGIPPEVRDKIFSPFFTTKPADEGTGLGLSLSYDIVVKQHAGSIEVDTQPGQYTEFRIVLPRSPAMMTKSGEAA